MVSLPCIISQENRFHSLPIVTPEAHSAESFIYIAIANDEYVSDVFLLLSDFCPESTVIVIVMLLPI